MWKGSQARIKADRVGSQRFASRFASQSQGEQNMWKGSQHGIERCNREAARHGGRAYAARLHHYSIQPARRWIPFSRGLIKFSILLESTLAPSTDFSTMLTGLGDDPPPAGRSPFISNFASKHTGMQRNRERRGIATRTPREAPHARRASKHEP